VKIELETRKNQQFLVTAVITCRTTKENPQSESTKNFDNLRRLGKLDVGFLHENFQRLFFRAKKSFHQFCVSIFHSVLGIKIHEENPQRFHTMNFRN